jgi:hypothetical protein
MNSPKTAVNTQKSMVSLNTNNEQLEKKIKKAILPGASGLYL